MFQADLTVFILMWNKEFAFGFSFGCLSLTTMPDRVFAVILYLQCYCTSTLKQSCSELKRNILDRTSSASHADNESSAPYNIPASMAPNSFRRGRRSKLNQTSNIAERVQDTLLKTQAANQKRASDAISNLMVATLGGAKTKYTVERAKIVEENFVSLVNATSDFPITISDMQQRGRKRQRDSIDRKSDPQVPAAPKTKKQKTVPTPCLTKLQPQPLQMVFQPHPDEDRSNGWYRNEFRKLFSRIETFACEHFGVHDVSKNDNLEPWTLNFSPEFLRYVEVVADEDPYSGGWDPLLKNTIQRQWLVVAILSRIIVVKVFSTDLWGADEEEKDLILGIERAFLGGDGMGA
jgi:hypothetical protein